MAFVVFMWVLSYLIARLINTPLDEKAAFIYFMSMTNVIFMGLPVCKAIFGEDSVFYVSVVTIAQDTVLWTIGVTLLAKFRENTGEKKSKIKVNPITIAFFVSVILKILGVSVPTIIYTPMEQLGNSTPYLAMLYLGMLLSFKNISYVVVKWRTYIFLAFKLVIFPLVAGFIVYKIFGASFSSIQKGVFVVEFATSSVVALLPVFKDYDLNPEYASGLVFLSTIICLFTLPVVLLISNKLFT
jgi:predicted permease